MTYFTLREMELAREMHQNGIWKEPQYGDWYIHTPPETLAKLVDEATLKTYYHQENNPRKRQFIWLPNWKQGRQWLREKGYSLFQFSQSPEGDMELSVQKGSETLTCQGFTEFEVLYEIMSRVIKNEQSHDTLLPE